MDGYPINSISSNQQQQPSSSSSSFQNQNQNNQLKWSTRTIITLSTSNQSQSQSQSQNQHQNQNRSRIQLSNLLPTILVITSFIPLTQSFPIEQNLDLISSHQAKPQPDLTINQSQSQPSLIKQSSSSTPDSSNPPQSTLYHLNDPSTSQSTLEYTSHPNISPSSSALKLDHLSSSSTIPKKPQNDLASISTLDSLLSSHDTNPTPLTNPTSQSDSQDHKPEPFQSDSQQHKPEPFQSDSQQHKPEPFQSDSQPHTPEPSHPDSQISFSPTQSHRLSIPIKSRIPTYYENVNGIWVLSDNWNLYGLSGPSQRHRPRGLPTNSVPRSSKQPRSAPLVHHTSLAARTNEIESNASLSNNSNTNMNSSTNLDLPAGWNHTSPRGPMYVVPAIVIASLFIAISVVGTVVCLVGRRRKNKRISTNRRNEEAEVEGNKSLEGEEKRFNEMSEKGKRKKMSIKHLMIVQFKHQGSKKNKENGVGPNSILILDESPRLGKRSFHSGIGSRLIRRRKRGSDKTKGIQSDKNLEDDQKPSSGCSGSSGGDGVMVNELSNAPKSLTDDGSGVDGSRGTTDQSSAPITNTSHGHDTVHTTSSSLRTLPPIITSFNLRRSIADDGQTEALTATALTRQSAQLERTDELQEQTRTDGASSVHNTIPSLQISQHPSLPPIMGPRSIFPDDPQDPHLEDLPPEPPAYTTSRKSEDKRPMRRPSSSSTSSSNRHQYIGHVATDDKLVLGNIARLASSAPLTETDARPDQGPSAPPLVWEEPFLMTDENGLEIHHRGGILPAPSMEFVTSFDPNRKDEEKMTKEEEMRTWALLVEPSRPESEDERRAREVGSSVPQVSEEEEEEDGRRERCLPIAPPYEEQEEMDQGG